MVALDILDAHAGRVAGDEALRAVARVIVLEGALLSWQSGHLTM